jgi:hypothetical protein
VQDPGDAYKPGAKLGIEPMETRRSNDIATTYDRHELYRRDRVLAT